MNKREGYIMLACIALLTIAGFIIYFCLHSEIEDIEDIQKEKLICLPRVYETYEGDIVVMQCAPESIFNEVFDKNINIQNNNTM